MEACVRRSPEGVVEEGYCCFFFFFFFFWVEGYGVCMELGWCG